MAKDNTEDYELIAKRCPDCESLIMAKLEPQCSTGVRYSGYMCSRCGWESPFKLYTK